MLATALVVAAAVLGRGAVRRLGWSLAWLEAVALAAAIALTVTPWVLFLSMWALGAAVGLPFACAVLLGGGVALGRGRTLAIAPGPGPGVLSWTALALLFGLLFHGHMLHAERGGLYTGGSSFGDLALHATLAQHFSIAEVDLASPLVAGEPLTYPFLGDFLVGALVRGGWSISTAFAVTGWLSVMTGLALIHALALRLFGRRSAATLAVWLIVLSGSTIGAWYALRDLWGHGLPDDLGGLPNYSHMRPRGVVFANVVCDFFLPQRALVSALPGFWAGVLALQRAWGDRPAGAHDPAAARVAGVAIGLLPLLHAHSFLVGIGLLCWLALWRSVAARRIAWPWWAAVGLALALATPQLAWQFGRSWQAGFGRWDLGWLAPSGHFWRFWLRNWGPALVLAPVAVGFAWRTRGGFALPLTIAALVVFAGANLYQFQPHDWDNMKFFVYAYMFVAIAIAGLLASWLAAGGVRRAVAPLVIVLMTVTGAISIAREAHRHDQLASTTDLRIAAQLRAVLPADARVLTSDQHNHVVPMLTGRAIVMGYRGWLWTHGIDYRALEQDVGAMFAGGPGTPALLRRRGVTHVYIGPGERGQLHADAAWFRHHYPRVFHERDVEVFDVRAAVPVVARAAAVRP